MSHTRLEADFCCTLRRKFLIAIVQDDTSVPLPTEAVDCIDFGDGSQKPTLHIKFCPFCGKVVTGVRRVADLG